MSSNYNSNFEKIEPFLVLTTTSSQELANRLCQALEDANVPVMIEHVLVPGEDGSVSGFKLLAPTKFRETAQRLVEVNRNRFEDRIHSPHWLVR